MIKVLSVVYLISVACISLCNALKYPTELSRCKFGDTKCLMNVVQSTFDIFVKGYPSINMPPLEPLHINEILIKQGSNSPVNIELTLSGVNLHGLTDLKFSKIVGFSKDPNGIHELHFKIPVLMVLSDYTISGQVLILPIQGDGKSNMTVVNLDGTIKFKGSTVTRSGKDYMKMENYKLTFTTTRLHMHFSNLFRGDKLLGDNTNLFLNENWQDIFNELKKNIFDAFGQVMEGVMNTIFARIPYKDLFIE